MNRIELELAKRKITKKEIAKEMGLSAYQLGQKLINFSLLKYDDIEFFRKKFNLTYEELFIEEI